jgi:hypothetical protein
MSSAAKAKPVVLAVGDGDAGEFAAEGGAGESDGEAVSGAGDAVVLGLTTAGPQAARRTVAAATDHAKPRG